MTLHRRMAALWLLALALCAPIAALSQEEVFPTFKGRNLLGESVSTDSLRGKEWLVVVGFDRSQSAHMREWAVRFRQAFPDESRADYCQIAAMPGNLTLMRGFIQKKMVSSAPEPARKHIVAIYAADAIAKQLKIQSRKTIHVFVLDRDGRITHRDADRVSEENFERVRKQLARQLQQSSTP